MFVWQLRKVSWEKNTKRLVPIRADFFMAGLGELFPWFFFMSGLWMMVIYPDSSAFHADHSAILALNLMAIDKTRAAF